MGLWLALSERHGSSGSMPKGWGKAGQAEVLMATWCGAGAFGEACGAGDPRFCLSPPWPLPQTCSSTSRTAGTWPSTTRADFSRCGSTRAPACSSLGTWRCSSRGSWTTPPHPSPGRTAVGRGPPPPHREATPGASLPHEAEPPSSCTQPPAAPRSPLTPGTTSRTDTSPLPHLVLPRAQGAPWPPSRGTDPSTFLERHRHFPLVRLKAGGLGAGSG